MVTCAARISLFAGLWNAIAKDFDKTIPSLALDTLPYDCAVSLLQSRHGAPSHASARRGSPAVYPWMQQESMLGGSYIADASLLQRQSARALEVAALRREVKQLRSRLLQHMMDGPANATSVNVTAKQPRKHAVGHAANDKLAVEVKERTLFFHPQSHSRLTLIVAIIAAIPPFLYFSCLMHNRLMPGDDQSRQPEKKKRNCVARSQRAFTRIYLNHKFGIAILLFFCVTVSFLCVAAYFGILQQLSAQFFMFAWIAIIVVTIFTLLYSEWIVPIVDRLEFMVNAQKGMVDSASSLTQTVWGSKGGTKMGTSRNG